jgi:hypothetical protein
LRNRLFDDGLDRREAGSAGDQQDRLCESSRRKKLPCGPRRRSKVAFLQGLEDVLGELSPGYVADMQLQKGVVVRRVGQRESSPLAFLEQDVHVLPGEKLQALAGRQLEFDDHHVRRARVRLCTRAGKVRIGMSSSERISRLSMTRSLLAMAQQKRASAGLAVGFAEDVERCLAMRNLLRSAPCPDKSRKRRPGSRREGSGPGAARHRESSPLARRENCAGSAER